MQKFFTFIFKTFSYFLTGLGFFVFLLFLALGLLAYQMKDKDWTSHFFSKSDSESRVALADSMILTLDLTRPVNEKPILNFSNLLGSSKDHSFLTLIQSLQMALDDPKVKAIYAKMNNALMGTAQIDELTQLISKLNKAGKKTLLFSESLGHGQNGTQTYYLASAFDQIWLQPMGSLNMVGLMSAVPFGRGALEKLGVEPNFYSKGAFKSAPNSYTEYNFTDDQRLMIQDLLESLSEVQIRFIAKKRFKNNVSRASIAYVDGPYYDQQALKSGLIDRLGYSEEAKAALKANFSPQTILIASEDYFKAKKYEENKIGIEKSKIAFIVAEGMIAQNNEQGPFSNDLLTPKMLDEQLALAEKEDQVKAVIIRINSPGGDAVASETMRHRIEIFRKYSGKPVIISMGNMAASGGYWIAINADRILADPSTLTGSIGAFLGKFNTKGLWDKLGIHWGIITIGKKASFYSYLDGFNQQETSRVNESLERTYEYFSKTVAKARGLSYSKISSFGEGRVWTGVQAYKLGLVDGIGGVEEAYAEALGLLNISGEAARGFELTPIGKKKTSLDLLLSLISDKQMSVWNNIAAIIYGQQIVGIGPSHLIPSTRMGTQMTMQMPFIF